MLLHENVFRRVVSFDELTIISDNARRPTWSKSENGESFPPLVLSTSKSNLRKPSSKQCRWNSDNQAGKQRLKMSHTVATITTDESASNHLVGSRALLARRRLLPPMVDNYSNTGSLQNDDWQKVEKPVLSCQSDSKKRFDLILSGPPRKPIRSNNDASESSAFLNKTLSALQKKNFGHPSIMEKTKCSPMGLRMPQRSSLSEDHPPAIRETLMLQSS
jgi:hypothetical protein